MAKRRNRTAVKQSKSIASSIEVGCMAFPAILAA